LVVRVNEDIEINGFTDGQKELAFRLLLRQRFPIEKELPQSRIKISQFRLIRFYAAPRSMSSIIVLSVSIRAGMRSVQIV
jgi:hypothetical protein